MTDSIDEYYSERDKEKEKARQCYLKQQVKTKEDLDDLIVDMMCEIGPDGHCDGHEIMTINYNQ